MARRSPSPVTEPLSSISLPNSAPSKKIGKNWARKRAVPPMKVWVQWASSGSPAKRAATSAAAGASSSTLQLRNAKVRSNNRPSAIPSRPMKSDALQQEVEVERRAPAEVGGMRRQEGLRRTPPLVPQHGQE